MTSFGASPLRSSASPGASATVAELADFLAELIASEATQSDPVQAERILTSPSIVLCSNQFLKQEPGSCVDIKKFAESKVVFVAQTLAATACNTACQFHVPRQHHAPTHRH